MKTLAVACLSCAFLLFWGGFSMVLAQEAGPAADGAGAAEPATPDVGTPADEKPKDDPAGDPTPADPTATPDKQPPTPVADPAKDDSKKADDDKTSDAKTEVEKPKPAALPATPYERKLQEVEKQVAAAKAHKEKIPEVEAKVNVQISKLTDSSKKPIEPRELQRELAEHRPSKAARTYRDLNLALAREYEKVKSMLLAALKSCLDLERMKTADEDLKVKAEALAASIKEQCIEVLLKLAGIYESVAEDESVTSCYKQILALDKENSAAVTYFKELKEKEKQRRNNNTDDGSGSYYNRGGGYGR